MELVNYLISIKRRRFLAMRPFPKTVDYNLSAGCFYCTIQYIRSYTTYIEAVSFL